MTLGAARVTTTTTILSNAWMLIVWPTTVHADSGHRAHSRAAPAGSRQDGAVDDGRRRANHSGIKDKGWTGQVRI